MDRATSQIVTEWMVETVTRARNGGEPVATPDVDRILGYSKKVDAVEDLILARIAMASLGDIANFSAASKADLLRVRGGMIECLSSSSARMRASTISVIDQASVSPLRDDPEITERIRALRADPDHKVRGRAERVRLKGEPPKEPT